MDTGLAKPLAHGVVAVNAIMTCQAGNVVMYKNAVSKLKGFHIPSNLRHHSRRFMAKNKGCPTS
jgi:hypothetical protein